MGCVFGAVTGNCFGYWPVIKPMINLPKELLVATAKGSKVLWMNQIISRVNV